MTDDIQRGRPQAARRRQLLRCTRNRHLPRCPTRLAERGRQFIMQTCQSLGCCAQRRAGVFVEQPPTSTCTASSRRQLPVSHVQAAAPKLPFALRSKCCAAVISDRRIRTDTQPRRIGKGIAEWGKPREHSHGSQELLPTRRSMVETTPSDGKGCRGMKWSMTDQATCKSRSGMHLEWRGS